MLGNTIAFGLLHLSYKDKTFITNMLHNPPKTYILKIHIHSIFSFKPQKIVFDNTKEYL